MRKLWFRLVSSGGGGGVWILALNIWNDAGTWIDTETWND